MTGRQVKRGIDRHLSCCPRPLETARETERERVAVGGAKGEIERGAEGSSRESGTEGRARRKREREGEGERQRVTESDPDGEAE